MLAPLFPRQFDNAYRGLWPAVWLFIPIVLLRLVIGMNSMLMTRRVAMSADGIPLDRFDAAAAREVISEFAHLGLFNLLFGLVGVVALVRYRSMVPFVYLLFLVQQLAAKALNLMNPTSTGGASSASAGSLLILSLLAATVLGLVLSLIRRRNAP